MALHPKIYRRNEGEISDTLIVLIHGLGAPDTTWTNGGFSWIDLLLTDVNIPNIDVAYITYDTAHLSSSILQVVGVKSLKVGFFKKISVNKGPFTSIKTLSQELKRELNTNRVKEYKRIILVGHSMGGLIGIRYLLEEVEHKESHNIKGFVSLATPYNGSSKALYAALIKNLNQHAQIPSLEPNSDFLDDTIRLWQKHLYDINTSYKFFFGTDDTIVTEKSAIPHIVSSKWTGGVPLPGDHSSILHVESHQSTSYVPISEFIKEIIEKEDIEKKKKLHNLKLHSKARCFARWQASGLTKYQAEQFSQQVQYDYAYLEPSKDSPISIIVGEFGIGKSLVADLMFQKLLENIEENLDLPFPIFLKASTDIADFQKYIEKIMFDNMESTEEIHIIIDGMDEVNASLASKILEGVRISTGIWGNLRVVMTSRPIAIFSQLAENKIINKLSQQKSMEIISCLLEQELDVGLISTWPETVKDAISRPLFAILLGTYLKKSDMMVPNSTGDLLVHLMGSSLSNTHINNENSRKLLKHLALLSTDRGNVPIHKNEVTTPDELKPLLDSRLVMERDGLVSFSLPILSQWFAALALADELKSIDDILSQNKMIEYWKYPLIIFITLFNYEKTSKVLPRIVESNPAFASILVHESIASWGLSEDVAPPPVLECGQRIRESMQSWVNGIGSLADNIAPVDSNNNVLPIGVSTDNGGLTASWYSGYKEISEVTDLIGLWQNIDRREWPSIRFARPGKSSNWAWRWTIDELKEKLSTLIKNKALPICSDAIYKETMWLIALTILNKGTLYSKGISLDEIEIVLQERYEDIPNLLIQHNYYDLTLFKEYVSKLKESGISILDSPWPESDLDEYSRGWIWDPYSPERLLERTKSIYEHAIKDYKQLVEVLFPTMKTRLKKYVLFPCVLTGNLEIPIQTNSYNCSPSLDWYLEPLLQHEDSRVEITLNDIDTSKYSFDSTHLERIYCEIKRLRPHSAEWISANQTSQILEVYGATPVTDIVYKWIQSDLKSVYWVK